MEFKVENLCGFLIRSKLMTPDEMRAMSDRWKAEAGSQYANVPAFTKWLVAKGYVTEYQASLLTKGQVDDFFLDQYKILERLGRGRMAGVYKAARPNGQFVAIKVLPPSHAQNPGHLARFKREAELSLKLKHPNVVRSFQVGEARGLHYLVMEYLEGETLDEVLARRKRLPPQEAVRLIHQALTGLQHIHEQSMVHRDLKPANLMLVPRRAPGEPDTTLRATVKILDIGLGRTTFEPPTSKAEITGEGVLLGTPDYLAPEQARDARGCTIQADIYSLGCVLYHLLAGQPPFPDANILSQMVRHATETPRPLKEFNSAVPDGLAQIVGYMMAKQPQQRYPTPERAAQALQVFLMSDSDSGRGAVAVPLAVPQAKPASAGDIPRAIPVAKSAPETPQAPPMGKPPSTAEFPKVAPPASWLGASPPTPKAAGTDEHELKARATPVPPSRDPQRSHKRHKHKSKSKHKHRHKEKHPDGPALAAPAGKPVAPAAATSADIDVELVPLNPNGASISLQPLVAPARRGGFKRDLLLIGIGALLFLLVAGGCVLAYYMLRSPAE